MVGSQLRFAVEWLSVEWLSVEWLSVEWLSVELKHNEILWSQREIFRKWF